MYIVACMNVFVCTCTCMYYVCMHIHVYHINTVVNGVCMCSSIYCTAQCTNSTDSHDVC